MLCSRFERGLRNTRETTVQAPRSPSPRKRRCFRHCNRNVLAAHEEGWGDTWCPSEAHGGQQWSRYPPAVCGGTYSGPCQSWMKLQVMETPHMNRFLTGDKAHREKPKLLCVFERNCGIRVRAVCSWRSLNPITWKKPIMKQFLKCCCPWGGILRQFGKDCIPLQGPHTVVGHQYEEERTTDMKPYEMTSTHFLQVPEICKGRR